jgi:hypothetical protein
MQSSINVRDESRCPTIPCPKPEKTLSWFDATHRSRVALCDEIFRLEQELARISRQIRFSLSRQRVTLDRRMGIWADLLICRSMLLSLGLLGTKGEMGWVEESTIEQQLEEQAMKRIYCKHVTSQSSVVLTHNTLLARILRALHIVT